MWFSCCGSSTFGFNPGGVGYGGDVDIASGATVDIDSFTVAHTGNIVGTYIPLP